MKRIDILLSIVLIAIFLVACGTRGSNQNADDVPTNSLQSQKESSSSEVGSSKNEAPSSQEQETSQETASVNSKKQIQIATESGDINISAVSNPLQGTAKPESSLPEIPQEEDVKNIQVTIGNEIFTATLSDNVGADAFAELLRNEPLAINMSDYSGFEKVGSLGANLPASNSSITATEGDIVLYNGNQICMFYGSNSWSYTRLAKVDNLSGWKDALGSGDVTITFSLK